MCYYDKYLNQYIDKNSLYKTFLLSIYFIWTVLRSKLFCKNDCKPDKVLAPEYCLILKVYLKSDSKSIIIIQAKLYHPFLLILKW